MESSDFIELSKLIETNHLWYQDDRISKFIKLFDKHKLTKAETSLKAQFKDLFKKTNFYIGEKGYNWDQWRLPIEYAVIHHTSSAPTISLKELNILGLRLYIEQYLKDKDVQNRPIYSGHYWYGKPKTKDKMTFVSYHYLIRPNGKIIQLVDDPAFLWHAGNLEINRKSIGIALAGKFIDKEPTPEALDAIVKLIKAKSIKKENVYGHQEVIKKEILGETTCPGNSFLNNWKEKIISKL